MTAIVEITAREILDSRGNPTERLAALVPRPRLHLIRGTGFGAFVRLARVRGSVSGFGEAAAAR